MSIEEPGLYDGTQSEDARDDKFLRTTRATAGEGHEHHLLVIGISAALLGTGAGKWPTDRLIGARAG